ncbi:N-acetylglucosamine 6-phosphate deacetylase [Albidovulum inexpectatum]|uniref:N-acetylglucosamine 6-phosphate deacetylase n=1 Tax=Albidovulum inexpectatum TaxID=196587 RepID=A0A2S5JJ46_9RHOB|nr:N-acetylglucosamine-6-phosphate deacetylase [Albidovulum inexpectatum]PPB81536.1 N-acetylglucosamine 6-phosphate deacetylase [Albidovulum inexpectatum]
MTAVLYTGARIFDGWRLYPASVLVDSGRIAAIVGPDKKLPHATHVDLDGGILAPGLVDLQVNGGGGILLNDAPSVETLRRMVAAHERLGVAQILPTLITDSVEKAFQAVDSVEQYLIQGGQGILGLHLEGPHLNPVRKGAHDAGLVRPMTDEDEGFLIRSAARLPCLMVTLAPEIVPIERIARLASAGVIVSLGHSDCDLRTARDAIDAGARVVTHLFNAMSQMGARSPGLVGAALTDGRVHAGLIADGVHVDPATIRVAFSAKAGPGGLFLVSDSMAVAGTDLMAFKLNGRDIRRDNGRLTLADGTLAGADLDLPRAMRIMVNQVGVPVQHALAMATRLPAEVIGARAGCLMAGLSADIIHLSDDLHLRCVLRAGQPLQSINPDIR